MTDISINTVSFSYDGAADVLSDLSFSIGRGESLLIVGDNGSGKSTLGRLLSGLLKPSRGAIRIAGKSPHAVQVRKRSQLVSYIGQVSHLSVLSSSIGAELCSFSHCKDLSVIESDYRQWANRHLLPLDMDLNPRDLTMPDLWRLVVGFYAIALQPSLLIVDEMISAGNERQMDCARDLLARRKQEGRSTIFMYQRTLDLAFDRIYNIENRRLLADHG